VFPTCGRLNERLKIFLYFVELTFLFLPRGGWECHPADPIREG
jgi:hypothetical protein